MTTLSQFTGTRSIASIVNNDSAGSTQRASLATPAGCKMYASGVNTANALATILSISGAGCVNFVSAYTVDTTSRTVRLKITVDGVVIFDATSAAINSTASGIVGIGSYASAGGGVEIPQFQPVVFKASLLVEVATSVASETSKITTAINYETDA